METQNIRIKLKAYDHRLLDQSVKEIVNTAKRTGARVRGPEKGLARRIRRSSLGGPEFPKACPDAESVAGVADNRAGPIHPEGARS